MPPHSASPLLALTGLLAGGIGAQWLAWRLRLPSILVLLAVGLAAGSIGLLDPDALFGELLFPGVSLAVAVILFEGGLTLERRELPAIGSALARLMLIGLPLTFVLAALAAHWTMAMSWPIALIAGALLTVTGPTVVGPLLQHIRPKGQVAAIAKWEGILADVLGATLAVLVFEGARFGVLENATGAVLLGLGKTLAVGAIMGGIGALLLAIPLARRWVPDALDSPLTLAWVLSVYTVSQQMMHESGLLAVTLMGIALANQKRVSIRHIVEFKENLRVLLISALFIVLAARLNLSTLFGQPVGNWIFVLSLVLVVRPASVFLSLLGSSLPMRERLFLAWLAPRGIVAAAVSAVFALRLAADGVPGAEQLAPLVFLVIAVTVAVYGLSARPLARALGIADSNPQGVLIAGASPFARRLAEALHAEGIAIALVDTNRDRAASARLAGLRSYSLNILSESADETIPLGGIGRLLALLPNDEVNSLACLHYSHTFGRAEVYKLPPRQKRAQGDASSTLRGRTLFGEDATFEALERRLSEGWVFKRTPLTETFELESWRARYGESALILARVGASGELQLCTPDNLVSPSAGEVVIALIDPEAVAVTEQPAQPPAAAPAPDSPAPDSPAPDSPAPDSPALKD